MASFDENGKYIKTNWKAGDKITATKLNKIEESIEAVNDNDISRHVEADARLDALEAKDAAHDKELTNVKNTIADNKAAAELGDYEINSRMTFLENELNEGIEEVHNVADTVDGKIAQGKADMEAMVAEIEPVLEELHAKDEELSEQVAYIENEKNNEFFNLNNFKKLDDDIDDTDRIQRALDYCVENNLTLLIPHGDYVVSQRDEKLLAFVNDDRGYCVYKENSKINIVQLGKIKIDLGDSSIRPNIFTFENCEVNFTGGLFEGLNNNGDKKLYSGNSIILVSCYNSKVDNVKTYSTNGGPLLMKCKNSIISNCYFENTSQNMGCCGTAFGIYGGEHNEIFKCISYGSTGDGDISLYGTGESNKVTNSKCFNSLHDLVITNTGAQGICVDAGQNNATVSECYAYGYYYGIDVKTNIENCNVINNIVERCKVGLTLRYGEAGGDNTFATFRGNTVLNPYNGRDNIINNNSYWCGFFIEKSYGVNIKDNVIIKRTNYTLNEKGTGIIINDVDKDEGYNKEFVISGNSFYDQASIGSITHPLKMDNIYINLTYTKNNISINNNVFTGGYGSKTDTIFINIVKGRCVHITNNLFGRIDNLNGGLLCGDVNAVNINSNSFKSCKGLLIASNTQELNIANNVFEGCGDWKPLITGAVTGVCNFTSNIFKANTVNTGTLVSLQGSKKLIATNNILYMNRGSRNEFVIDAAIDNVINANNYIEHTS